MLEQVKNDLQKIFGIRATNMLSHYRVMHESYLAGDFEKTINRAGKFVESTLKGLHFITTNPNEFLRSVDVGKEISRLENLPRNSSHSAVRLLIPRACRVIYFVRSDRGTSHDVDDIEPNYMDASMVIKLADWILGELFRLFHTTNNLNLLQNIVNSFAEFSIPLVTEIDEDIIVLHDSLSASKEILLTLNKRNPKRATFDELDGWLIKHKKSNLETTLRNLREKKLVHLNKAGFLLTPLGKKKVQNLAREFISQKF